MIEILKIPDVLDTAACVALRAELCEAGGRPATVLGDTPEGTVRPRIRSTTRAAIPPRASERIKQLLLQRKPAIERHFNVTLGECEEPQFLRYQMGDFFAAHQDGNTPLLFDESRFRKISAVIFLSAQSEHPSPDTYGGGEFVFHGPYTGPPLRLPVVAAPGTLLAFRAETTHEVTPVTHGERFTIVSWYR